MKYVVVGAGYTGQRVLAALPVDQRSALSRTAISNVDQPVFALDLDNTADNPEPSSHIPNEDFRLLYSVPPAPDSLEDRRLSRLLRLLEHAPETIVYISTSGVYGDCQGKLIDESWPARPAGRRATRRRAAEKTLQEWCEVRNCNLIIFRVPAIYGPGRLGLDRLHAGQPFVAEAESAPGNRIHVEDLSRCCVTALTSEVAAGIYNVGDGDHRSPTSFARTVARLAGVPPPRQVSRQEALQTFNEGRLATIAQSRRLDNRKLLGEMGAIIAYTNPEDGIRASLNG